ncbi:MULTISPECIES: FAD-binding oxidoreductase [unclassified Streptomyces]|uniref:FAD-binding oxidoreductase n=1 Tax=unclassified Streptomyces TaxID=2593676 RepID=UPI002DDC14EF|nr:FAD-binding oxidoreductase [Streptomyces sp. NBC_01750]WSB03619.1 FAD-binding oxidoreductase [Streptomyces sp. NBC_01794]WSD32094.1 FAD-binding oxidoreductase [Streptomyces sp. NBC_01750]
MAPQGIAEAALAGLRQELTGTAVAPGDQGYDDARAVFNGMLDRRPAVVAQCETEADVARAIRFGRDNELEIAVRGGGHSVAGMSSTDGGIVVDLGRMHTVIVDPASRAARVGGGATMSHLDRATQPFSLATTGGRASTTGVGGFTLGGGSGWLERKYGLACDNLIAAELVTADGETVHASADENAELFWALHGGGGNFGVVTAITLQLHSLPAMSMVMLLFRPEAGPEVVRAFRDFMESAPDEAGGGCIYLTGAPEPFVPEHLVGRLVCAALVTYTGTEAEARQVTEPLLGLGHDAEVISELPYAELQCMLDDPPGMRNYWSAEYLDSFPDEGVDAFCSRADTMPVPTGTQHVLFPMGGAVARSEADYPLPWRTAQWAVHPFGIWEDPADDRRGIQWVRDVRAAVRPWSQGTVYLNFIGDEGRGRVLAGFGEDNYKRLAAVKAKYDPSNVFRRNHNIKPLR